MKTSLLLMQCRAVYHSELHDVWSVVTFLPGHSLRIPSQTSCNSFWTRQEPVHCCHYYSDLCSVWPVTANEKQTKFQDSNCPCLCAFPHYPWHFNSPLNYFQIRVDNWFIQRRTLQRKRIKQRISKNRWETDKSKHIRGGLHTFCGLSEQYRMFHIVTVVSLKKCLRASVKWFQVFEVQKTHFVPGSVKQSRVKSCEDTRERETETSPDCHPSLSARLPASRASQMVLSAIMAVIKGSLLLISTPSEHNVHHNVCCVCDCTTPIGLHPFYKQWILCPSQGSTK